MVTETIEITDVSKNKEAKDGNEDTSDVVYKVDDVPPWYLALVLGFQHYLTMFSGAVSAPYLISTELCTSDDHPARGLLISTTFFVSGIATFFQATFGNRLPIIQGPSLSFLVPTLAILNLPQWECPSLELMKNMTKEEEDELWMERMREVQGAIIVASTVEVLIGLTGLVGLLMRWITPLVIIPTITLIGLSLFEEAAKEASHYWPISLSTMLLLIIFSQYMTNVQIPVLIYNKKKGCHAYWFPFFKIFPVMLTIVLAWGLCAILTVTDAIPKGNSARTDLNLKVFNESDWIRVPYPGQWGTPTVNVGPVLGVIAGVLASTIESVGDYYACARLAGAPPPPVHAMNRGIFMEGIGSVLAGCFGSGSGLTSFSQNIGAIGITKVGSRRVVQFAAIIMILFGMLGKFGALFNAIPSPVMGGIFCVMFAIITGVGLSNLQYVNLNNSRNIFILGFSIFMGLCIPKYLQAHPNAISTGNNVGDQILAILLKTSMFVGGFLAAVLDNTIPGTEDERGIARWRSETCSENNNDENVGKTYNIPFCVGRIKNMKILSYLPVCPTFETQNATFCCRKAEKNLNSVRTCRITVPIT